MLFSLEYWIRLHLISLFFMIDASGYSQKPLITILERKEADNGEVSFNNARVELTPDCINFRKSEIILSADNYLSALYASLDLVDSVDSCLNKQQRFMQKTKKIKHKNEIVLEYLSKENVEDTNFIFGLIIESLFMKDFDLDSFDSSVQKEELMRRFLFEQRSKIGESEEENPKGFDGMRKNFGKKYQNAYIALTEVKKVLESLRTGDVGASLRMICPFVSMVTEASINRKDGYNGSIEQRKQQILGKLSEDFALKYAQDLYKDEDVEVVASLYADDLMQEGFKTELDVCVLKKPQEMNDKYTLIHVFEAKAASKSLAAVDFEKDSNRMMQTIAHVAREGAVTKWKSKVKDSVGGGRGWKFYEIVGYSSDIRDVKMTYLLGSKASDEDNDGVITAGRLINRPKINKRIFSSAVKAHIAGHHPKSWDTALLDDGVRINFHNDSDGDDWSWRMEKAEELESAQREFLSLFMSSSASI